MADRRSRAAIFAIVVLAAAVASSSRRGANGVPLAAASPEAAGNQAPGQPELIEWGPVRRLLTTGLLEIDAFAVRRIGPKGVMHVVRVRLQAKLGGESEFRDYPPTNLDQVLAFYEATKSIKIQRRPEISASWLSIDVEPVHLERTLEGGSWHAELCTLPVEPSAVPSLMAECRKILADLEVIRGLPPSASLPTR
ncbi:MAG: hypothetical protein IT460_06535 [Planctomycetes bacterium]|nr:hypothetical protein [Planctomycetota bacterium]